MKDITFSELAPSISIVVVTKNRLQYLQNLLRSFNNLNGDLSKIEIIIADNGSTDGTSPKTLELVRNEVPAHFVTETKIGINFVRNTGWRAAFGELIAFVDDDAVLDPDWLIGLRKTYNEFSKNYPIAIYGGRTVLRWKAPCPDWLTDDLKPWLSCSDYGSKNMVSVNSSFNIVGANFAISRENLEKIGGFNTALAAYGRDERWIEEMIHEMGGATIYAGEALVFHSVHPERCTKEWFKNRFYREGVAIRLYETAKAQMMSQPTCTISKWILKITIKTFLSFLLSVLTNRRKITNSLNFQLLKGYYSNLLAKQS